MTGPGVKLLWESSGRTKMSLIGPWLSIIYKRSRVLSHCGMQICIQKLYLTFTSQESMRIACSLIQVVVSSSALEARWWLSGSRLTGFPRFFLFVSLFGSFFLSFFLYFFLSIYLYLLCRYREIVSPHTACRSKANPGVQERRSTGFHLKNWLSSKITLMASAISAKFISWWSAAVRYRRSFLERKPAIVWKLSWSGIQMQFCVQSMSWGFRNVDVVLGVLTSTERSADQWNSKIFHHQEASSPSVVIRHYHFHFQRLLNNRN